MMIGEVRYMMGVHERLLRLGLRIAWPLARLGRAYGGLHRFYNLLLRCPVLDD
jgi:hypothetical protein